jgi:hypothetical protein
LIFRHFLFKYHYIGIFWGLAILLLSGLPGSDFPDLSFWRGVTFDKFAHMLFYAVFVVLLAIGEVKHRRFSANRSRSLKVGFVLGGIYGVLIELMQAWVFTGRSYDISDIMANTIGCLIGVIFFKVNFNECLKTQRW